MQKSSLIERTEVKRNATEGTEVPKMKRKGKLKEKLQSASSRIPEMMRNANTQLQEAQLSPEQIRIQVRTEKRSRWGQGGAVNYMSHSWFWPRL